MQTMVSTAGAAALPVESDDSLAPGAKAGPWIIERELGRGGMGAVYACVHEEIGKRAALKVMHRRLLTPSFSVERILLEAKVVNAVGHPGIVDIFETGTLDDGRPYIVMERLEGMPLSYRVEEGKMLPTEVIAILVQLCDALVAAHAANVVHRDLKLDNVFLIENPDEPGSPKAKILDWGIAKVIDHDVRHTIEGQLVGTPQYLSPEQAKGARVTPQSDVYSLGVMAYEMFLEQLPFEAETAAEIMAMHLRAIPPAPSELWPEIPTDLERLLLLMLAKSPDNRPSMKEVAMTLASVYAQLESRKHRAASVVSLEFENTPSAIRRAGGQLPRAGTVRPVRASSEAAHAPTMAADSVSIAAQRGRRWKVAIGAFALTAATVMFFATRGSDPRAANAEPPPQETAAITEAATPTEHSQPVQPANIAPDVMSTAPTRTRGAAAAPAPKHPRPIEVVTAPPVPPAAKRVARPTSAGSAVPRRAASRLENKNATMSVY